MKKVLLNSFLALMLVFTITGLSFSDEGVDKNKETKIEETEEQSSQIDFFKVLKALPETKHGVAFSINDSKFNYLVTIPVATFKDVDIPIVKDLVLEVGYSGASREAGDKFVGVISYPVFDAIDYVQWPIVKYIKFNIGAYAGVGRINLGSSSARRSNNDFDFGISATAVEIKF